MEKLQFDKLGEHLYAPVKGTSKDIHAPYTC